MKNSRGILRHLWFNVHKSMFDKLTVKELRNEVKGIWGIKNVHKMTKKELIDTLIEEGLVSVCLSSRDLTPKRICELRKLVGENNYNQMDIHKEGHLEFHIGNDLKFDKYCNGFTHKECEIFDELGYDMNEYFKMSEKEQNDVYSKIYQKRDERWGQYCDILTGTIRFDETKLVEIKGGSTIRFNEFDVKMK